MDKYIKESDLFKRILNVDFKHDYDGCIKFCQSIPAADVAEVRHGKWIDVVGAGGMLGTFVGWKCTICGYEITDRYGQYNYCPNCGASMRGEEE